MSVCNPPTKTQFSVPPPDMPAARQLHSKLWPPDGKCAFQIVSCKLQALEGRENKRGPGCLEEGWKVWGHSTLPVTALSASVHLTAKEGESSLACGAGHTVLGGGGTVEEQIITGCGCLR